MPKIGEAELVMVLLLAALGLGLVLYWGYRWLRRAAVRFWTGFKQGYYGPRRGYPEDQQH